MKSTIQVGNLQKRTKEYRKEILSAIRSVLDSGVYLHGEWNKKLTSQLARYFPGGHILTVGSGHDALMLALQSLHLGPTDEVIFPVNVYPTAFPVCMGNWKPVPVDVDQNGLIDPAKVRQTITPRTKAIITVHLYGLVAPIDEIKKSIGTQRISIIEDCAQAIGSMYHGRHVGTLGDIGCFSFYPTKNIGTFGDGGALWVKKKKNADFIRMAASYGERNRYQSEFLSGHSRMPEIQAAIASVMLKHFHHEINKRNRLSLLYRKELGGVKEIRVLYTSPDGARPLAHLFVIAAARRDLLREYLRVHGVETSIHYPVPVHMLPAFAKLNARKGRFPVAEELSGQILSLPFYTGLTTRAVHRIAKFIKKFYA